MPRGHVLVLDDEPTILTTLQKALTLEGYAVDVAGGIAVAEEKLHKRSYDIALFDVSLPDGDGVGLLQRLRTSGNDLPVVMMSGHATIDAAVRATRLGASDFLE
ncbi:MAG: response regulator [Byssovorax sp.]